MFEALGSRENEPVNCLRQENADAVQRVSDELREIPGCTSRHDVVTQMCRATFDRGNYMQQYVNSY